MVHAKQLVSSHGLHAVGTCCTEAHRSPASVKGLARYRCSLMGREASQ